MSILTRLRSLLSRRPAIRHQQLAMVALAKAQQPDAAEFFRRVRERWPDLPPIAGIKTVGAVISATLGNGSAVACALMPLPIPDLSDAPAMSPLPPEAAERLAVHQAHTIIHVVGASDPIHTSLLLTRLVASYAEDANAIAVYWGNAGHVHEPRAFLEQAMQASSENLPLPLWIGFDSVRDETGARFLRTVGMPQYGLMNIEVPFDDRDFDTALELAGDVALYLMEKGPVINDGDTLGRTEADRTCVYHRPSVGQPDTKVYYIAVEPAT